MVEDTELMHQDDVCNCGAKLDCWEGDFHSEGYRYIKWICQRTCKVVHTRYKPIQAKAIPED